MPRRRDQVKAMLLLHIEHYIDVADIDVPLTLFPNYSRDN